MGKPEPALTPCGEPRTESSNGSVSGFTLRGGAGYRGKGGGLYSYDADTTFRELIVRDNQVITGADLGAEGGGLYAYGDSLFEDVTIEDNLAQSERFTQGGGIKRRPRLYEYGGSGRDLGPDTPPDVHVPRHGRPEPRGCGR